VRVDSASAAVIAAAILVASVSVSPANGSACVSTAVTAVGLVIIRRL
jgi:hypothetical protein